jgi:hypothetical protein
MVNVPNPIQYQTRVNKRIQAAINELVEKACDDAFGEFGGRLIRFNHHWHEIDRGISPVVIEARITNAFFDQGDEGGNWHLLFEVTVRNPHTGRDETITLGPGGFEFI